MKEPFLKLRLISFAHAFRGIFTAFMSGINLRIQLFMGVVVVILGFILNISLSEWVVIVLCIGTVLAAEVMNSALEKFCDRVSTEKHPLIKAAKDMSAGAVLILAVMAAVVGLLIFLPKIV